MAGLAAAAEPPIPIIDTHIHLFDPTRPEGIPWPPKDNAVLYKPALPARYRQIAVPLGVRGAIEVECSTWVEDNQWVLDVCRRDRIMLGTIGNLDLASADFGQQLERFRKDPLFLGIRYGNLWNRDLGAGLAKPDFVAGLKALAGAGLTLDSANPNPELLGAILRTNDRVPGLRIVVDHLPQMTPHAVIGDFAKRPNIWVKISEVHRRVDGRVPADLAFYQERLDAIYETFGADRVLYGSDWPNSDQWVEYPRVLAMVREYFESKTREAREKYFWRNSVAAYRWKQRDKGQPAG